MSERIEQCTRCFERPGRRERKGPPLCPWCRPIVAAEHEQIAVAAELRRARLANLRRAGGGSPYCGLSPKRVLEMHAEQDGRCLTCQKECRPFRGQDGLQVDHCHRTGVIRGLICGRCNKWLGRIDDDVEYLERLAAYLRRGEQLALDPEHPRWTIDRPPRP